MKQDMHLVKSDPEYSSMGYAERLPAWILYWTVLCALLVRPYPLQFANENSPYFFLPMIPAMPACDLVVRGVYM